MSRMRLDVLSSPADWAFVMAEADALQSEDPSGCVETARQRAQAREGWRYELVAAELMRRGAERLVRPKFLLQRARAFEDDPVH